MARSFFGAGTAALVVAFDFRDVDVAAEFLVVPRAGALELADFAVAFFAGVLRATGRFAVFFVATAFFAETFLVAFFAATFLTLRFAVADFAVDLRAGALAVFRPAFFLPALRLISLPSSGDRSRGHDARTRDSVISKTKLYMS
jgi:hypothetical protein